MLHWANQFNICCFLDSHHYNLPYQNYKCILAVGAEHLFSSNEKDSIAALRKFSSLHNDWLFGHFSYDVKNQIEELYSKHDDHLKFPEILFFIPQYIIILEKDQISISAPFDSARDIHDELLSFSITHIPKQKEIEFLSRFSKEEYINTVNALKTHIHSGDCYEINFCQEFFYENALIDPLQTYILLSQVSPNPFSAFYKIENKFLLCASPERYLKKFDDVLLSQPIKGTGKRNLENEEQDVINKEELLQSAKERSENVMIVDLVRNDLSKVCKEGTVTAKELYTIYSFPQVHQMVSTITGKVKENLHWTALIEATFPMGSMTGAPKKKVMELIERYEKTRRGLFSGALGYVTPEGNFDFNVVIRSILYNEDNRYLSYQVGSGITFYSDPEKEYDECMLKAEAIKKVLT